MRKLLILAVLALALPMQAGHAATLAECTGAAGVQGTFPPSVGGPCVGNTRFTLASATSLSVTISPGPGYTGFVRARVTSNQVPSRPESILVEAFFVGGAIVRGAMQATGPLPAGAWRLTAEPIGRLDYPYSIPGLPPPPSGQVGAGSYSVSVATSA